MSRLLSSDIAAVVAAAIVAAVCLGIIGSWILDSGTLS
jgi:hypothetical protein